MNYPNSFGGVRVDGGQVLFGATAFTMNGSSMTVTTIGGVVHVTLGAGCAIAKQAPKVAP